MTEYGIFNDECEDYSPANAVESGFYSWKEAEDRLREIRETDDLEDDEDDGCYVHECEDPEDEYDEEEEDDETV